MRLIYLQWAAYVSAATLLAATAVITLQPPVSRAWRWVFLAASILTASLALALFYLRGA